MPVLRRILTENITLKKKEETELDTEYGSVTKAYTSYTVRGLVIPTSVDEVRWIAPGYIHIGDARGFFYPSYEIDEDTTISPVIGDRVVWEGDEYTIDKINHYRAYSIEFLECTLRKML